MFFKSGLTGIKGNVISFEQDLSDIVNVLPRLPQDLPYIILQTESKKKYELKIRPQVVLEALKFLKVNNPAYSDIIISDDNLKYYQDNNGIVKDIVNLNYAYDPTSKETLIDSEVPLNERDR